MALLAITSASPLAFVMASAMLATAIPKAGFLLNGLPLPIMMFVLLFAAILLRQHGRASETERPGSRLASIGLAWLLYRLVALHLDGGSVADGLALAGWYGLPLVLLIGGPPPGALSNEYGPRWAGRLENGIVLACAFSLVQRIWGVTGTAIPGVTRAVGVDYSAKPLQFSGGSKIPSTYQNGNILGVITAFFFLIAAERILAGKARGRDRLVLIGTLVATLLSGSRTVVIGLAIGFVVLLLRSGLTRRTLVVLALAATALVGVLHLSPALSNRLIGTKASDPSLAVRAVVWKKVVHATPPIQLLVGGPVWAQHRQEPGLAEGMLGAFQQVGVVGMTIFVGVFFAATNPPHLRRWRIVLIPVGISLLVDSAYLVFPTLFIPLARMFAPLHPTDVSESKEDPGNPESTKLIASSAGPGATYS
ncbi:MAG: hypothetical protein LC749_00110 [Actinobacteria bacterium]|nr:hypothetical protein [Actinomycetota bacterium]